mgnify:CR=1 FL=1
MFRGAFSGGTGVLLGDGLNRVKSLLVACRVLGTRGRKCPLNFSQSVFLDADLFCLGVVGVSLVNELGIYESISNKHLVKFDGAFDGRRNLIPTLGGSDTSLLKLALLPGAELLQEASSNFEVWSS